MAGLLPLSAPFGRDAADGRGGGMAFAFLISQCRAFHYT